jgi:hypothetical protein
LLFSTAVGPHVLCAGEEIAAGAATICVGDAASEGGAASTVALSVAADAPSFALSSAGTQKQSPRTNSAMQAVRFSRVPTAGAIRDAEMASSCTAT